jgi:hypothetical protein
MSPGETGTVTPLNRNSDEIEHGFISGQYDGDKMQYSIRGTVVRQNDLLPSAHRTN